MDTEMKAVRDGAGGSWVAAANAEYRRWGTGRDSRRPPGERAWACRQNDNGSWLITTYHRNEREADEARHEQALAAAIGAALAAPSAAGGGEGPGDLDRVPEAYREKVRAVLGFTDEDWLLLRACFPEVIEQFRQVIAAAPSPSQGSDTGEAERDPTGPGSRPSDQAAAHPAPAGFDPSRADGLALQVADQCRVVAHLATALARVHSDYAKLAVVPAFQDILDQVGERSAALMEQFGDVLNEMDASSPDDEWTYPIFERAQRLYPLASAGDTAKAAETGTGSVHEHAVGRQAETPRLEEATFRRQGEEYVTMVPVEPAPPPTAPQGADLAGLKTPCVPDCSVAEHLDYLEQVIEQRVGHVGVEADALAAIRAIRVALPLTGENQDRLIITDPGSVRDNGADLAGLSVLEALNAFVIAEAERVRTIHAFNDELRRQRERGIFPPQVRPEEEAKDAADKAFWAAQRHLLAMAAQQPTALVPATSAPPFRTGDHILHKLSGETWVCAWADPETGYLSWLGWPPGEAKISDFELAKAATDEEHHAQLRDLKRSTRCDAAKALRLYGDPDASPPTTTQDPDHG